MGTIIDKLFDFIVQNLWENIVFWRVAAILFFVLSVLAFTFKKQILKILQRETIIASDKVIFTKSDQIFNERQFMDFIDNLGVNRCNSGQNRMAVSFTRFFREVGNQYLDKSMRKSCNKLINELEELLTFVATHFFVYPNKQDFKDTENVQSALYPDILHGSTKNPAYQDALEYQKQLYLRLDNIVPIFKQYRTNIKDKLFV